jgi:hypothetical protein
MFAWACCHPGGTQGCRPVQGERNHDRALGFVQGRYGSSALALVVAISGIVATMPYIAFS